LKEGHVFHYNKDNLDFLGVDNIWLVLQTSLKGTLFRKKEDYNDEKLNFF